MTRCCECGQEHDGHAALCDGCASTDVTGACGPGDVVEWVPCPLCNGSGRCFYCSPLGPCYHCSGSGREQVGSMEECHICGGLGDLGKGCEFCAYTRRCTHCGGTGKVPASVLRAEATAPRKGTIARKGAKGGRGARGAKGGRGGRGARGASTTKPSKGSGKAKRAAKGKRA